MNTLIDVIFEAADSKCNYGVNFINIDGSVKFVSYQDLLLSAFSYYDSLKKLDINIGTEIIIAADTNEEIIPVLWGCILSGIVPTILPSPASFNSNDLSFERLVNVYKILNKPNIILSDSTIDKFKDDLIEKNSLISISDLTQKNSNSFKLNDYLINPLIKEDSPSFIQFSSGSTGAPKGVVLTHSNILSNLDAINQALKLDNNIDIALSWMPLYHDMGLFGFHFTSVYSKCNHFLIDTITFIKKPLHYLEMIDRFKITITGSTNFGLNVLNKYYEKYKSITYNLSSLNKILIGAEPISINILNEFADNFKNLGLANTSLMPVYGLSEATLAVAFSDIFTEPVIRNFDRFELYHNKKAVLVSDNNSNSVQLVGHGKTVKHCSVIIAGENGNVLDDGFSGRILIKGENVFSGYYKSNSTDLFRDAWFDTGDSGFIYENNLFINGRYKDIIFVNGMNYFSNDLENIALQIEGVSAGKVIIAGIREKSDSDKILLFLSGTDLSTSAKLFCKINNEIKIQTGISLDILIPIKSNEIPKTTSGKIQRYKLTERFLKGEFDEIINQAQEYLKAEEIKINNIKIAPKTVYQKILHKIWYIQLKKKPEEIGIHDDFLQLGGKSFDIVEILANLEHNYNVKLHSSAFAENRTIAALAEYIEKNPGFSSNTDIRPGKFSG